MRKRTYSSYNLYFIVPFILWIIVGGILLLSFDKTTLFAAVNTHYNSVADQVFYFASEFGEAYTIIAALLVLLGMSSLRNWWFFTSALVCNIIPTIVEQQMKHYFNAPRPINYFHNAAWIHVGDNWPVLMTYSFPSGHSTGSFAFFCFLSLLLKEKYKKWGLLFFVLAMVVCYSRMYLAAHFFADVYCGSIIGGAMCIMLFAVMRKYQYLFFKKETPQNTAL